MVGHTVGVGATRGRRLMLLLLLLLPTGLVTLALIMALA